LDVPIPILARTIEIGGNAGVGRECFRRVPSGGGLGQMAWAGGEVSLDNRASAGSLDLPQESRIPPPPPSLVVRCPGEVEQAPRSRHRHIKEAPLLGDDIFLSATDRLQHGSRQPEPRQPPPLRHPAPAQTRAEP